MLGAIVDGYIYKLGMRAAARNYLCMESAGIVWSRPAIVRHAQRTPGREQLALLWYKMRHDR
jgi:hypothetical protein